MNRETLLHPITERLKTADTKKLGIIWAFISHYVEARENDQQ